MQEGIADVDLGFLTVEDLEAALAVEREKVKRLEERIEHHEHEATAVRETYSQLNSTIYTLRKIINRHTMRIRNQEDEIHSLRAVARASKKFLTVPNNTTESQYERRNMAMALVRAGECDVEY